MRRDPNTGLVRNERLILVALLELRADFIYPYALTRHWKENPKARSLPYSTLYRCLHKLEELDLMVSRTTEDSGGPPRREYALTGLGIEVAVELSKTLDDRLAIPKLGTSG